MSTKIHVIVGARPNFMKAAPVIERLRSANIDWTVRLIHTGQHYDEKLSDLFFRQLNIPTPDVNLGLGSGTHAIQSARAMIALEEEFLRHQPDLVIVFGDVNSTLATALVTSKLHIKLAHVEAGLRSYDREMPEEINRILTDAVSDYLFTTEQNATQNLIREGVAPEKIFFVGNTMIDTLIKHKERALALDMPAQLNVASGKYAVVTLHRPSNVDSPETLNRILIALNTLSKTVPVLFPVHPRTASRMRDLGLWSHFDQNESIKLLEPLGYLEFIGCLANAGVVITDSGGIQEETTILGTPCITFRTTTERPITVSQGTNVLVGENTDRMLFEALKALSEGKCQNLINPEKWDGCASNRIVDTLKNILLSSKIEIAA